jgi:hypothetical protein
LRKYKYFWVNILLFFVARKTDLNFSWFFLAVKNNNIILVVFLFTKNIIFRGLQYAGKNN